MSALPQTRYTIEEYNGFYYPGVAVTVFVRR
jgi:hypothetical protein